MIDESACPVCGYPDFGGRPLTEGLDSFDICPSCGFEFGFDDGVKGETYETYRARWIANGSKWWSVSDEVPEGWDPAAQIASLEPQ